MKALFPLVFSLALVGNSLGDIQDPPAAQYGPARKFGRGVSNMLFGWSEVPSTIAKVNEREGNHAAASYGVICGANRAAVRFGAGFYEVFLWPFPLYKGSYYPVLRDDTHWIHYGYGELPSELGNESKYPYVRQY
jgi:putative exosortase-associated protein (TIGR04073 family)